MIVGIDMGHTLSGKDYGAVGHIKETDCTREIGNALISYLETLGHTVINCTADYANSVNHSLQQRVSKANAQYMDLYVSIHLNSGGGYGAETYIVGRGGNAEQYATKVNNALVDLGYRDRGVKVANFYVLRNTNAPAILVECGFVDSWEDSNRYNADNIAKAIAEAITGQTVESVEEPVEEKLGLYYVVSKYLKKDSNGYTNFRPFQRIFPTEKAYYVRQDNYGIWIETAYLSPLQCMEIKEALEKEDLFYSVEVD